MTGQCEKNWKWDFDKRMLFGFQEKGEEKGRKKKERGGRKRKKEVGRRKTEIGGKQRKEKHKLITRTKQEL